MVSWFLHKVSKKSYAWYLNTTKSLATIKKACIALSCPRCTKAHSFDKFRLLNSTELQLISQQFTK